MSLLSLRLRRVRVVPFGALTVTLVKPRLLLYSPPSSRMALLLMLTEDSSVSREANTLAVSWLSTTKEAALTSYNLTQSEPPLMYSVPLMSTFFKVTVSEGTLMNTSPVKVLLEIVTAPMSIYPFL